MVKSRLLFFTVIILILFGWSPVLQGKEQTLTLLDKMSKALQNIISNFEVRVEIQSKEKKVKLKNEDGKPLTGIGLNLKIMLPEGVKVSSYIPGLGPIEAAYLKEKYLWAEIVNRKEIYKLDLALLEEAKKASKKESLLDKRNAQKKIDAFVNNMKKAGLMKVKKTKDFFIVSVPLGSSSSDAKIEINIVRKSYLPVKIEFFAKNNSEIGSLLFSKWKKGTIKGKDIFLLPKKGSGAVNEFNPMLMLLMVEHFEKQLENSSKGF
ncbi:hypothetical protein ACFL35_16655 [Candidatus Riflebacteria bacterium]